MLTRQVIQTINMPIYRHIQQNTWGAHPRRRHSALTQDLSILGKLAEHFSHWVRPHSLMGHISFITCLWYEQRCPRAYCKILGPFREAPSIESMYWQNHWYEWLDTGMAERGRLLYAYRGCGIKTSDQVKNKQKCHGVNLIAIIWELYALNSMWKNRNCSFCRFTLIKMHNLNRLRCFYTTQPGGQGHLVD